MTKTFINFTDCPFQVGDDVQCIDSELRAYVHRIEDEHIWLVGQHGEVFYRTWSHANGGLKLVRREPPTPPPAEEATANA